MSQLTTLRLLKGVDLTKDYTNTFKHSTLSAQTSFFIAKSQHTFENLTYQRREGTIKVNKNVDTLYDINYLMFQNANYSNKWFYAFVVDMEWLSEDTTKVTYEIDVMQTWAFEMDIKQSFVERECVDSDGIGDHLVKENLEIGDLVIKDSTDITELEDLIYIFVATEYFPEPTLPSGGIYTGVYSGLWYFATDDESTLNDWIDHYNASGEIEKLITIFTMPKALVDTTSDLVLPSSVSKVITETNSISHSSIDGYYPKNNKLYCYPYNFLEVTNNQGQSNIYRYEYFDVNFTGFRVTCNVAPSPVVYLEPISYKGLAINGEEFLTLSDYPLSPWVGNAYETWLAQNQVSNAVKVGGSLIALAGGAATANPLAIGGGLLGVASSIGSFYEQSVKPDHAKGSTSGGGNVARGKQTFTLLEKNIRYDNARIIDEYLSKYGYKVNRVKTPNITGRAYWNYVKLREPNIFGDIPNKDLSKINTNFERGITFWHGDNVGNYSLDNSL